MITVSSRPASAAYKNQRLTAATALLMSLIGFSTASTYHVPPMLSGTAARA